MRANCGMPSPLPGQSTTTHAVTRAPVATAQRAERGVIIFRKIWKAWLRFAEVVGTIQMIVLLTLIYIILVAPIAIVFMVFGDPLTQRSSHMMRWISRGPDGSSFTDMTRQG